MSRGTADALAGTAGLARLALRLDRVRLPIWIAGLAVMPMATAAQYKQLYPDDAAVAKVADITANPSLVALNGPLFKASVGGLTMWKIALTELVLIALMSVFTVVRHTRTEEETGRLELLGAGVLGRHAALTAALGVVAAADVLVGLLVAVFLIGVGMPAAGSVAAGLAIAAFGLCFAGVAGLAAQLAGTARAATGISVAVLGASYLLRAIGDTSVGWLSWTSPIGLAMRVRPYAGQRLAPLIVLVAAGALLTSAAVVLAGRRDLGHGLLAQRPGPATAVASLRTPLALAVRLHRGVFLGWVVAMLLFGATVGGAADGVANAMGDNQRVNEMLVRMGGAKSMVDMYLAAVFGVTGMVVAAFAVQATLRLRSEETSGRTEPLLATRVGRTALAASHLVVAGLGTVALLVVAGVGAGVAYGSRIGDVAGQVPRLTGAALASAPAALIFAGIGMALIGLYPRLTQLTWALLIIAFMIQELGVLLDLNHLLIACSPFGHVPKLPGGPVDATPLVVTSALVVLATAAGLVGYRRRDVG